MNKTISYIIAFINIVVSILSYLQIYCVMVDSHVSSKGWAEFFTLISSILFIIGGLSLTTIINRITKSKKYIIVSLYLLIGIVPLAVQNYFTLIPTGIFSIIVLRISVSLIAKINDNQSIVLNGILLVLNAAWGLLMIEM
jgi:hypothetical protein